MPAGMASFLASSRELGELKHGNNVHQNRHKVLQKEQLRGRRILGSLLIRLFPFFQIDVGTSPSLL